ncbi:zinc transporter ZIP3-like [Schistocerca gregaria]|uniref:zinc transporter ZIP3-like n=1 Tax=Schistocerca gregaria TaxID=7010 RepID=UPI00211EE074|nr:zinc transporter ZIP3-like [Schistocerca gregaria]
MEVIIFQFVCLVVLFVIMTVSGSIPIVIIWRRKNAQLSDIAGTLISVSNCVAGGVFMGMCFLGLFPFVKEKFRDVMEKMKLSTTFPIAEFVIGIGFFLILTSEQILISKKKLNSAPVKNSAHSFVASDDDKHEDESHLGLLEAEANEKQTDHELQNDDNTELQLSVSGHSHLDTILLTDNTSNQRSFMLLLAVSIHSLFEGITLGLQTDMVKLLHLFLAVLIHEVLVVLALGVNIAKRNLGVTKSFRYILMATGSIPVGMIVGLLIGTAPGLFGSVLSACLQGIAAGIFIHVTFMEIMPEEFVRNKYQLWKVLFFFIGFMLMAVVSFFLDSYK